MVTGNAPKPAGSAADVSVATGPLNTLPVVARKATAFNVIAPNDPGVNGTAPTVLTPIPVRPLPFVVPVVFVRPVVLVVFVALVLVVFVAVVVLVAVRPVE